MNRRSRVWTTTLLLLLWQLGSGLFWPATTAASVPLTVAGERVHDCPGHHHNPEAGAVTKLTDAQSAGPTVPPAQHPCCGHAGCKCQGMPPGVALLSSAPAAPSHLPAPSPKLDVQHLSRGPSDPFRPPIV